jgi:hypothetical protein
LVARYLPPGFATETTGSPKFLGNLLFAFTSTKKSPICTSFPTTKAGIQVSRLLEFPPLISWLEL